MRSRTPLLILMLALNWSIAAQPPTALADQAKREYLAADRELGRYVNQIGSTMNAQEVEKMRQAQETWVRYRDACAVSEASFYSAGSTQTLVNFTVMKELTAERLHRLKNMMAEVGQEAPPKVEPPAPDPGAAINEALTSPAITTDVEAMRDQLGSQGAANAYLDVIVPTGSTLVELLAHQNLNADYLKWITEHPEAGRDIVRVAVAKELRARATKDKKGYKENNLMLVTQFIQGAGRGGVLNSQIGQIAGDLAIKPLPPYQFFVYITQQNGMKELTEAYIASKLPAKP